MPGVIPMVPVVPQQFMYYQPQAIVVPQ